MVRAGVSIIAITVVTDFVLTLEHTITAKPNEARPNPTIGQTTSTGLLAILTVLSPFPQVLAVFPGSDDAISAPGALTIGVAPVTVDVIAVIALFVAASDPISAGAHGAIGVTAVAIVWIPIVAVLVADPSKAVTTAGCLAGIGALVSLI